jgi:acyl-CoA thioester hydrolase
MTFETDVAVRYDDIDSYGHVNNATYGTYLEEARIDYMAEVMGEDTGILDADGDTGTLIKTLELEFERPLELTDHATVALRIPDLGTTSFRFEYEIRDRHGVVATAETTVITFDREAGEPTPIPDEWRDAIAEFEGL